MSGPKDAALANIGVDKVVRFNYRMNCLADQIVTGFESIASGPIEKIVLQFSCSSKEQMVNDLGDIYVIIRPWNEQLMNEVGQHRVALSELESGLRGLGGADSWQHHALGRLSAIGSPGAHTRDFGKPTKRRLDGAIAQGIIVYEPDFVSLGARVSSPAGTKQLTIWRSELGRTYWSQFSGLLGALRWTADGALTLIPKKSWGGDFPSPITVE